MDWPTLSGKINLSTGDSNKGLYSAIATAVADLQNGTPFVIKIPQEPPLITSPRGVVPNSPKTNLVTPPPPSPRGCTSSIAVSYNYYNILIQTSMSASRPIPRVSEMPFVKIQAVVSIAAVRMVINYLPIKERALVSSFLHL